MSARLLIRAVIVTILGAVVGCGQDEPPWTCEDRSVNVLESGTYASYDNYGAGMPPHPIGTELTAIVDTTANLLTLIYDTVNGEVVETWSLTRFDPN